MGAVKISVPAQPAYVHILRSVVAGTAAKASLPIDEIEDVRLAVDEACAHLLSLAPGATTLTVEIEEQPNQIEVFAAVDAPPGPGKERDEESITWHILSALTDGARLEPAQGTTAIRLTKNVSV